MAGQYKDVQLVTHSQHDGWVRKGKWNPISFFNIVHVLIVNKYTVKYYASLDAIISCGTTDHNSIVLAYIEKASNSMRTINFSVKQGVSDFDYSRSINLIVSAGVDRMIRLWNPYVTSKPVGLMEGHTSPIVAIYISASRGQVFSLCAQKVLRVWDIQLQACLQIVSGVFPRGPPVTTNMFFEEGSGRLFAMFNNQLCMLEIKPEVKNRVVSHERPVSCVIYSSKFNQIITACADSVIAVWMLDTGQRVRKIPHAHGEAEITCMILSQSQQRFLTGATDGMIKVCSMHVSLASHFLSFV
jgi:WD40 repeat protein